MQINNEELTILVIFFNAFPECSRLFILSFFLGRVKLCYLHTLMILFTRDVVAVIIVIFNFVYISPHLLLL